MVNRIEEQEMELTNERLMLQPDSGVEGSGWCGVNQRVVAFCRCLTVRVLTIAGRRKVSCALSFRTHATSREWTAGNVAAYQTLSMRAVGTP